MQRELKRPKPARIMLKVKKGIFDAAFPRILISLAERHKKYSQNWVDRYHAALQKCLEQMVS